VKNQMKPHEIDALNRSALEIMSQMVSGPKEVSRLLKTIVRKAITLVNGRSGGIFEYHANQRKLELVADWGIRPTLRGHTVRFGEGLAGLVVKKKEPKSIADYDRWRFRSKRVSKGVIKAVVGVPLLLNNEALGVLFVANSKDGRKFNRAHINLLNILASYAAIAISKASALTQLRVLDEINSRLAAAVSLDEILRIALEESLKALNSDEGSIVFVNRETKQLEFKHWLVKGKYKEGPEKTLGLGVGIAGRVAITGVPYNCRDTRKDPQFEPLGTRDIRSLLCVPIVSQGRVTYVLNVDSLQARFFTLENQHFLSAIAGRVAVAIEAQNLRDIGAKLFNLSAEESLNLVVQTACALTGMESSTIFVKSRLSNELHDEASYAIRERRQYISRTHWLTKRVIESERPIMLRKTQRGRRVHELFEQTKLEMIAGVPLRTPPEMEDRRNTGSRSVGALFLFSSQPDHQLKNIQTVLKGLAAYTSMAIKNAWLLEAERHRVETLDALHRASLEITTELQMPTLGRLLLDQAVSLLQASGGALYLTDEEKRTLRFVAVSNLPDELLKEKPRKIGKTLAGQVIKEAKASARVDYYKWKHRLRELDPFHLTGVAAAPIQWQGTPYGAIAVHHQQDGRTFTNEDLDLLSHIGNLAAVALANARRTDDLKKVMDSSFDAIIAVDEKGRIVGINDRAKSILGRENEKMERQDVRHLYYDPNEAHTIKTQLQSNEEGRLRDHPTYIRGVNDEKIPILLSASVLLDYDGSRAGSVGFFQDQRTAKRAQREVRVLQGLLASSRVVASTTSLKDALRAICDEVTEVLQVDSVTLYRFDSKTKTFISYKPEQSGVKNINKWVGPIRRSSPVMKAIKIGEAQFIEDASARDSIVKGNFVKREGIRSCVTAPLKIRNETIGVMFLNYKSSHRFSAQDKDVIRIFARNVAIVIENARLYEESREQRKKLAEIQDQNSILKLDNGDISFDAALRELADQACRGTHARFGALAVFDHNREIQEFVTSGVDAATIARIGGHPQGLGVLALLKGHHEISETDIAQHPKFREFPSGHPPVTSFLGIPIEYRKRIIGSFYVGNKQNRARFTAEDSMYLRALAGQAAIAIENARLYESTRRSFKKTDELRNQTKTFIEQAHALQQQFRLAESTEPSDLLNQVMRSAMEQKNADSGTILLYDPSRKIFVESMRCNQLGETLGPRQTSVPQRRKDIAYEVALLDKAEYISDVKNDARFSKIDENWVSVAVLPLKGEEGPLGVLYLNWNKPRSFPEEERRWLESLAAQASIAVAGWRTRIGVVAAENINSALLLVSRWSRKLKTNTFALNTDIRTIKRGLPEGMFSSIFERMSSIVEDSAYLFQPFLGIGTENEHVDLKALISESLSSLSRSKPVIEITFRSDNENGLVTGNAMLVQTAVEILIENAVFSIKRKEAAQNLTAGRIDVELTTVPDFTSIRIFDNGAEVPPDLLRRIYRISKEGDSAYGYSLAATILRRHKGGLRIVSTGREGTTIEFWLPTANVGVSYANAKTA